MPAALPPKELRWLKDWLLSSSARLALEGSAPSAPSVAKERPLVLQRHMGTPATPLGPHAPPPPPPCPPPLRAECSPALNCSWPWPPPHPGTLGPHAACPPPPPAALLALLVLALLRRRLGGGPPPAARAETSVATLASMAPSRPGCAV